MIQNVLDTSGEVNRGHRVDDVITFLDENDVIPVGVVTYGVLGDQNIRGAFGASDPLKSPLGAVARLDSKLFKSKNF